MSHARSALVQSLVEELRVVGREAGLDAVGVAPADPFTSTRADLESRRAAGLHGGMQFTYRRPERSTDPSRTLATARSLVVGARSYRREPRAASAHPPASGRVARYARRDHYAELRHALAAVAARLEADGWVTRVVADDNALVDREAAVRAGLGWYGKSANVLLPGHGSWFVLGSVITDAPLPATGDGDVAEDGCGSCRRCIDGCPTGAIVAPGVVDARRCLAWLVQADGPFPREHRVALGDRLYGCDDCQEVCPPNRAEDRRPLPATVEPGAEADGEARVSLVALLDADDATLLERHGRWYIPKRQARYLRRNALVVLGNTAEGSDPAVTRVLAAHLRSGDPLVRAHAVWAALRLGRTDLLHVVEDDDDPLVRAELAASVEPVGR